ncbi:MAG: aminotransferase class I/II-fold pyridoxal phosphate-dependent enzyme [Candidatus Euphemobacter frigidus]|nr:aminotransferase class I/II-fold pyridoxal phosphate-dependent enzyme [Candidatus Euphemobacter frigidus]MDP8275485.1 aminotransferase class I/II-fold pyridoxal phosphate-dependent enzyme [Candidatus Euphemobacter frigidus]
MRATFLPFSQPAINQTDIDGVVEVLKSGWITTGPKTAAFEEAFRAYLGAGYSVSLSSGTAGMHLVLMALKLCPGDEVVTPSMTWGSTVNLLTILGLKPVFADIDRKTLMVTPESVRKVLTEKTRAIIPVHFAGVPVDLDPLRKIADEHNVIMIEDAAHALGTRYRGEPIGKTGTAVFSFHPIKNITTGEGGMVATDDEGLAEKVRILKFHGLAKDAWQRYSRNGKVQVEIIMPGFKYNLTDIQSSLGLTQLARVDELNTKRGELAALYDQHLEGLEEIIHPRAPEYPHQNSHHLYIVLLDLRRVTVTRDQFLEELKTRNIGTGIHFRPVHTQDYYREVAGYGRGLLPETEWVGDRLFSLPLFPAMTEQDVKDVAEAIRDTLNVVKK